jgi:hypothetical protein
VGTAGRVLIERRAGGGKGVRLSEHGYVIFNYTSPLDGPDVGWSEGQQGPTMIYGLTLRLPGG